MSERPYMPLWVGDFHSDTLHLNATEVGQYLLLLMSMWSAGGKLPASPSVLERIARRKVGPNVMRYFDTDGEFITQKRLTQEVARAAKKSERASLNGRRKSLKGKGPCQLYHNHNHNQLFDTPTSTKKTPRGVLSECLEDKLADAVLEHRHKIRAPLTVLAAEGLVREFSKCPDPNEAAREMVERGWRGFKAEWLTRPTKDKAAWERILEEGV